MSGVLAVLYREYLIRKTSPVWLFFDLMVPLLYLLMFGVGFNRALTTGLSMAGTTVSYNEFFFPSVLAMACFGNAINQSYGFFVDRDNGIFYEFLTYPITRGQFLVGKILFQAILSIVQCASTIVAGVYLLGISIRWEFVPMLFIGVVVGIAGWFFFMTIFAFLLKRNDTYNTVINVLYFVLMFISSLFYPLDNVPDWLRISAYANPLTWHTDALRWFAIGIGDPTVIILEMVLFAGFLVLSFWGAVRALQKAV